MFAALPWEISCRDVERLQQTGEPFLLVDCREREEYEIANIPGAVLIPMSELEQRIGELNGQQADRIIVHCHHGGRSLRVARWLRMQQFEQAQSMAGGIDGWSTEIDANVPRY